MYVEKLLQGTYVKTTNRMLLNYALQKLFDTPGVHLHHRQAAVVDSEDLTLLAPKNRLRAQSFPVYCLLLFCILVLHAIYCALCHLRILGNV